MNLCSPAVLASCLLLATQLDAVSQGDSDWRTPTEISGYRTTPDYAETVAYLERIAAAMPAQVRIENFGKTGEGRDLKIVIASKDGVFDPAAIHASGRRFSSCRIPSMPAKWTARIPAWLCCAIS